MCIYVQKIVNKHCRLRRWSVQVFMLNYCLGINTAF
jgi:hypothetical protein